MHIAIDDTYGPQDATATRYVTGARRTHVAVIFEDDQVERIREQVASCLELANSELGIAVTEFHFTDIYNRRKAWKNVSDNQNLAVIGAFADIYAQERWPVRIKTVDDLTFGDHGIAGFKGKIDGLDLSKREDQSLLWLVITDLMPMVAAAPEDVWIYLDEGRGKPGRSFGDKIFSKFGGRVKGRFESSASEPLVQIADFLAFMINRNTYLSTKTSRTDLDNWFLWLVGKMQIDCPDLVPVVLPLDFTPADLDAIHKADRQRKGLEPR
jgi:hypothetical protein